MADKLNVTKVNKDFPNVADMVNEFHEIGKAIKALEAEQNRLRDLIIADMGGAESKDYKIGRTTFTATYKAVTSTRVDSKKVKAKFPGTWEGDFGTTTTSPRFTIK